MDKNIKTTIEILYAIKGTEKGEEFYRSKWYRKEEINIIQLHEELTKIAITEKSLKYYHIITLSSIKINEK